MSIQWTTVSGWSFSATTACLVLGVLLFAEAMLVPPVTAAVDDCPFEGARLYPDESFPEFIVSMDVEGDGNQDLVTCGTLPARLNVFLGDGSGRFEVATQSWITGYAHGGMAPADFNGDGRPDLAVCADGVEIMLNSGAGGFERGELYMLSGDPVALAVGDLDQDGNPDIVALNHNTDFLAVLLGNGDGTFQVRPEIDLSWPCNEISVGDLDSDGLPDVALSSRGYGHSLLILIGRGDGTFDPVAYFGEEKTDGFDLGDLDGDGDLDAAVLSPYRKVTVYTGGGDGTFVAGQPIITGLQQEDVKAGDLDGDGDLDILVADEDSNSVIRVQNDGSGGFSVAGSIPMCRNMTELCLADLDGDSDLDLAATSSLYGYSGGAAVLLNQGGGIFPGAGLYSGPELSRIMVLEDFDLDGTPDAAVLNGQLFYWDLWILRGNGDGSFEKHAGYNHNDTLPTGMTAGDFNGDGATDLAIIDRNIDYEMFFFPGLGGGYFGARESWPVPGHPYGILSLPLNDDGADDLVLLHPGSGGFAVSSYLGHSSGEPQFVAEYFVGNDPDGLVSADFNADGRQDVAVLTSTDTHQGAWAVLLGAGDGTLGDPWYALHDQSLQAGACGDLDHDGILDLAAASTESFPQQVLVYKGNGDGTFALGEQFEAEYDPLYLEAGDLDGDGKDELLVGDGDGYLVASYHRGAGGMSRQARIPVGGPGPLHLSDLDGDSDQDLALVGDGRLWVITNTSSGWALAAGPGPGPDNPPQVRIFNPAENCALVGQWFAYGSGGYGVNVAFGELTGEGRVEVVTGPGPGQIYGPHVRGFDVEGQPLPGVSFLAYGTNKYGVNATCGDLDNDGFDEIVTGAGPGAVFGPHVRGWNWDGAGAVQPISGISYFAYGTPKWGVNVCCGDIDGDGFDEIVTGAGPGAVYGPHVRGWNVDGGNVSAISAVSFFAYGTLKYGVNVSCGDIDGDGIDEIVTGPGPGAVFGPQVRGWNWDGSGAVASIPGVNFFAYDILHWGANVSCGDVDFDGIDEIITGRGPGSEYSAHVRGWNYDGSVLQPIATIDFLAYDGSATTHGVKVAAVRH